MVRLAIFDDGTLKHPFALFTIEYFVKLIATHCAFLPKEIELPPKLQFRTGVTQARGEPKGMGCMNKKKVYVH